MTIAAMRVGKVPHLSIAWGNSFFKMFIVCDQHWGGWDKITKFIFKMIILCFLLHLSSDNLECKLMRWMWHYPVVSLHLKIQLPCRKMAKKSGPPDRLRLITQKAKCLLPDKKASSGNNLFYIKLGKTLLCYSHAFWGNKLTQKGNADSEM